MQSDRPFVLSELGQTFAWRGRRGTQHAGGDVVLIASAAPAMVEQSDLHGGTRTVYMLTMLAAPGSGIQRGDEVSASGRWYSVVSIAPMPASAFDQLTLQAVERTHTGAGGLRS